MIKDLFYAPQVYADILKRGKKLIEKEADAANLTVTEHQLHTRIYNNAFCGLLIEGYEASITNDEAGNPDSIYLTIDEESYTCPYSAAANVLRKDCQSVLDRLIKRSKKTLKDTAPKTKTPAPTVSKPQEEQKRPESHQTDCSSVVVSSKNEQLTSSRKEQKPAKAKDAGSFYTEPAKMTERATNTNADAAIKSKKNIAQNYEPQKKNDNDTVRNELSREASENSILYTNVRSTLPDLVFTTPSKKKKPTVILDVGAKESEVLRKTETSRENKFQGSRMESKRNDLSGLSSLLKEYKQFASEQATESESVGNYAQNKSFEKPNTAYSPKDDASSVASIPEKKEEKIEKEIDETVNRNAFVQTEEIVAEESETEAAEEIAEEEAAAEIVSNDNVNEGFDGKNVEKANSVETETEKVEEAENGEEEKVEETEVDTEKIPEPVKEASFNEFQPKKSPTQASVSNNADLEAAPIKSSNTSTNSANSENRKGGLFGRFLGKKKQHENEIAEEAMPEFQPNVKNTDADFFEPKRSQNDEEEKAEGIVESSVEESGAEEELPNSEDLTDANHDDGAEEESITSNDYSQDGGELFAHIHSVTLKPRFGDVVLSTARFIIWPTRIIEMYPGRTFADILVHVTDKDGVEFVRCTNGEEKRLHIVTSDQKEFTVYGIWDNGEFTSYVTLAGKTESQNRMEVELYKQVPEHAVTDAFLDQFRQERKGQPSHFIVPFKAQNCGEKNIPIIGYVEIDGKKYPLERREGNRLRYRYRANDKAIHGHWENGAFTFQLDDATLIDWGDEEAEE